MPAMHRRSESKLPPILNESRTMLATNPHKIVPIWIALLMVGSIEIVSAQSPNPIALSGYNSDIVTDADKVVRFATPADIGTADWFETGALDDNGDQHNDGLVVGNFNSAFTNTVSGGHSIFQLQPF